MPTTTLVQYIYKGTEEGGDEKKTNKKVNVIESAALLIK